MKLAIVGTGYVGLVAGTCFAEVGHQVTCIDIDRQKITQLKAGRLPFFEPGLEERVIRNVSEGRLHFTQSYAEAVPDAEIVCLALPTPAGEDGAANLSYLKAAVGEVARYAQGHTLGETLLVNKSTAPVGTSDKIKSWLGDAPLDVASNPEFLKQGNAVHDFLKPDRIILGVSSKRAETLLRKLYAPFTASHDRILVLAPRSAEMAKYAANAMLATRISFMNELASLCEQVGADIKQVRLGLGSDTRIGYPFLYAGAGFGGSCFPKDLQALQAMARDHHLPLPLIEAVYAVNERQKELLATKIATYFQGKAAGRTIGILGLSFKPETDDMRSAPSLTLIHKLLQLGCSIRLYDPIAMDKAKGLLPDLSEITWCLSELDCATGADALALVTEWKQFKLLDFKMILTSMCGRAFFDGRNQYSPQEMADIGFDYFGIGQEPVFAVEVGEAEVMNETRAGLSR